MDSATLWAAVGGVSGAVATGCALVAMVGKPLRDIRRQGAQQARRQDEFDADWYGEPARPGVEARPGVMERLRGIEKELHPNGGSTMRDAINDTRAQTSELRSAFDAHLRSHANQLPTGQ